MGVGNVQPMVRYQYFKLKGDGQPKPMNFDAGISYLIKGPALRVLATYSYTKIPPASDGGRHRHRQRDPARRAGDLLLMRFAMSTPRQKRIQTDKTQGGEDDAQFNQRSFGRDVDGDTPRGVRQAGRGARGSGGRACAAAPAPAPADDKGPIKVGILHSLSGTMAISETSLKDVALMTIDEINEAGGVLGRKLEPVVVDPASNWPLFAEKARDLIQNKKVAVTFGCWTSVSRKSVLPVFE